MNRVGIPCQIVVSDDTGDGVGHAWNVVRLGGKWFHVDLTWDDGFPDIYGMVSHKYFLKTDEQFRSEEYGHDFDWETNVKCDGAFILTVGFGRITKVQSSFTLRILEDQYNVIYRVDADTGNMDALHSCAADVIQLEREWYISSTYGFTQWNGRFYFNSERTVYSMLPDGTDIRAEYACQEVPKGYSMPDGSVHGVCSECDYVCVLQEAAPTNPSQDSVSPSGEEKRPVSMWWIWAGLGAAVLGGTTVILVRVLRRKKTGNVRSDL